MARRKPSFEYTDKIPKPEDCEHGAFEFLCSGYDLFKTCGHCCQLFTIGDLRDAAIKACDMPDRHSREEFFEMFERRYGKKTGIRTLAFQMYGQRKRELGERAHQERLKKYAAHNAGMTQLGSGLKTPTEHISDLRTALDGEVA